MASVDGSLTFTIPVLYTEGSHASYIDQDIALIPEPTDSAFNRCSHQSHTR